MTKTLTHTPTPWKAVWDEERETWRIWFKDGDFKDRQWEMTPNTIRYQADIDMIVKAVNSHQALLEAAILALSHIEGDEVTHGRDFKAGDALRAAIAKASPKGKGRND